MQWMQRMTFHEDWDSARSLQGSMPLTSGGLAYGIVSCEVINCSIIGAHSAVLLGC